MVTNLYHSSHSRKSEILTWSSKKKAQALGMVEGRGTATMTAENSEYPAQIPLACTKYLQNAKSEHQNKFGS